MRLLKKLFPLDTNPVETVLVEKMEMRRLTEKERTRNASQLLKKIKMANMTIWA